MMIWKNANKIMLLGLFFNNGMVILVGLLVTIIYLTQILIIFNVIASLVFHIKWGRKQLL